MDRATVRRLVFLALVAVLSLGCRKSDAPKKKPPPVSSARLSVGDAIKSGIRVVSPTERTITRAARDRLVDDFMGATSPARIFGDGAGVRLYGIYPAGVLAALGFENGDLVTSINDKEVTAEATLETFGDARKIDVFRIAGVRHGKPLQLVIRCVD
jgi:S1-C subfamily serine protease